MLNCHTRGCPHKTAEGSHRRCAMHENGAYGNLPIAASDRCHDHYLDAKRETIKALEATLEELRKAPTEPIHWGHAGDMEAYAEDARHLARRVCRTGEYDPEN